MPYAGLPDDADVSAISNAGYVGLPADAIATPLSRKEQLAKGAPMSSGEASDYMAQRAAFAKEGGVKMFAKAPPTDTRKISYTDTGYKPNKPAKSIKEFAKNAVQDVVELPMFPVRMAADIANAPDTVEAVKDAAKGLVTTPLGFVPYVSEMATGRTAAENWSTNPGIGALTVLGGGELARRAAPHVADFAIDGARKAAEVTGVPKVMDAAANKLYDMTLKQGTTLKPEIRAQNLETGLDGQYLPNSKGVDKLNADIHAKEQQLGSGIAAGEASNVTGTLDRAIANVSELREQAKRSADPTRNLAMIDAEIARMKGNPLQAPSGEIPISALQKMKVEQGQHVRYQKKNNQAVDPFQATIDKARIRGLRQELEVRLADAFPELADTNKQLGRMYDFQDVLERAASRIENNQGIGIGLPIKGGSGGVMGGMIGGPTGAAIGSGIGTLIGVIEHPAVAPRIALALRRAVKGLSKEDAGNIVNNRLNNLKGGLVQREQTVLDSESLPKISNSTLGDAIDPAAYQQTYDWSGKPPAAPEVANPETLPPRQIATNLGDELRPNDYAPVHGWEGKAPEQVIANPEALPPRQSSQMPQLSEQGGRVVPHVEAMTPRVPEGFNPEVVGMGPEDVQLGDRLAAKPRPLRNMPESLENTDAQNGPVAGLSEAVDTQVSPETVARGATLPPASELYGNELTVYHGSPNEGIDYLDGNAGTRIQSFYPTADAAANWVGAKHVYSAKINVGDLWDYREKADAEALAKHLYENNAKGDSYEDIHSDVQKGRPSIIERGTGWLKDNYSTYTTNEQGNDAIHQFKGGQKVEPVSSLPPSPKLESPAAHTWKSYLSAHMSRAMKETGGDHGKAMKLLGEEWRKDKSKDPLNLRGDKK